MKSLGDIAIISGARTPMAEWIGGKRGDGQPGGALASVSAIDLGAAAARAAITRAGIEPGAIDHVVMGNALQTSGDALYGARHVGLKAGVPKEVGALTVNRLCGSGHQSVVVAAQMIALGEATWVLASALVREARRDRPHKDALRLEAIALVEALARRYPANPVFQRFLRTMSVSAP